MRRAGRLFDWLRDRLHVPPRRKSSRLWRTELVSDVPTKSADGVLYVIGEGNERWFAALRCPCGCGDVIQLSLLDDDSPRWTVSGTIRPSIDPSIRRERGCRSHFWLHQGRISWAAPWEREET